MRLGHNVAAEYFAQDQYKVLDPEARMLDDLSRAALERTGAELRSLLGCFLFSGDDVFKPLGVLSGGERNRYALARILVSPANFLLLDEPTNHLDMRAKDVLLDALGSYTGTVIFVSHDRYFIDRLATRVLEIENDTITAFEGNYEDYQRKEMRRSLCSPKPASLDPRGIFAECFEPAPKNDASETAYARRRRLNPIKQKQMEDRCAFLEEEIPRIEASIAHTEEQLAFSLCRGDARLVTLAAELRRKLAGLTAEWEDLMLQLDLS